MSYCDYTYYSTIFLGTAIASADFAHLALLASNYIDRITYQRAAPVMTAGTDTTTMTAIQNATCAIAEQLQKEGLTGEEDNIQSESQGEYSVSYGKTAKNAKSMDTKRLMVAREWLSVTGILFPGFYSGEYGSQLFNDEFVSP